MEIYRLAMKVMLTGFPTISTAVEAVKEVGAFDYLPKPFSPGCFRRDLY